MMAVIRYPLITAVMGVPFDKGSESLSLEDGRNGLPLDDGSIGEHIDIW